MNRRRILVFLMLAVVGASLGLLAARVYGASTDTGVTSMVQGVVRCAKERNSFGCARPIMQRAIETGADIGLLEALSPQVTPVQCHYMGHVLGQELYRARKNVEAVLSECSRVCQAACVHGALGEAFTEAIGNEKNIDPEHLNLADIREKGKELCTVASTCHGVGHAILQFVQNFDTALNICNDIAPNDLRVHCYRGIFMEYADARAARSVLSESPQVRLTLKQLDSFCVRSSVDESRACFMYLPKVVEVALKEEGKKTDAVAYVRTLCQSLAGLERLACISGLGAYRSFQVFSEPHAVRDMCESFADTNDRAACSAGVAAVAAEHEEKSREVFAFCRSFESDRVASACFKSVFDTYTLLNQALCEDDARCLTAAQ